MCGGLVKMAPAHAAQWSVVSLVEKISILIMSTWWGGTGLGWGQAPSHAIVLLLWAVPRWSTMRPGRLARAAFRWLMSRFNFYQRAFGVETWRKPPTLAQA